MLEAHLEVLLHGLEIAAAASAGRVATVSLGCPVVLAHLGIRITTLRTALLLAVEGTTTATKAQSVGLIVTRTKRCCTLRHVQKTKQITKKQQK